MMTPAARRRKGLSKRGTEEREFSPARLPDSRGSHIGLTSPVADTVA